MKVIKAIILLLSSLLENPGIKMQAIFSRVQPPSVPNGGTWFKEFLWQSAETGDENCAAAFVVIFFLELDNEGK